MVKYGQKMKKKKSNERRETIEHVGGRKILILGHFSPEKNQKRPVASVSSPAAALVRERSVEHQRLPGGQL